MRSFLAMALTDFAAASIIASRERVNFSLANDVGPSERPVDRRAKQEAAALIGTSGTTNRPRIVERILHERMSAIIRTQDKALASDAMHAAVEGGFRMIEFTLTTPGALELIRAFSQRDDLLVGAGTVLTVDQARRSVEAGAKFIVSPIFDPVVVAESARNDVPTIPGAFSPTEMETAHRHGADLIKVFPAPPGGADFISAILAPLPHLRLFPTAGVTAANMIDFYQAGCAGVGFVKALFDPREMAARDFAAIRNRAADLVRRRNEWRQVQPPNGATASR